MIPYENIANVAPDKAPSDAEETLRSGWKRRNYPVVRLEAVPWELESESLRTWNFHIHSWDMLDSFLKAHSKTTELRFLMPAVDVVLDWTLKNADAAGGGVSPFAWYDMAVGLRAYRLAYIIDAGTRSGVLTDETRALLWECLERHRHYLSQDDNIAFHNNHGYYQIAGQLAMGRRFAAASEAMRIAFEEGKVRFEMMLAQQFGQDGVHREHSPDYHRMVYETLKALIDSGLVDDHSLVERANAIEESLSWFIAPDQRIVTFGDSDYRNMSRKAAEAERKWVTQEMRYVTTGGEIGRPPAEQFRVYPEGGYAVVRKPARDRGMSQSSYLAQNAAFHSRTHKHADDLSFVWYDRGSMILVDPGRYGYIGKAKKDTPLWRDGFWYTDPNRVYCESTHAHNCLEIDGRSYQRRRVKAYGSALKRCRQFGSDLFAIESECKHFSSIRHARTLVFNPREWLIVFDWFWDNHKETHDACQWFHFAPEIQVDSDGEGFRARLASEEKPLQVASLLKDVTPSRLFRGETEPRMQGWFAPREREIFPSYAFAFERSQEAHGCFATLFSFANSLECDRDWSETNASGRNARFRWGDERGRHSVLIARPREGALDVSYGVD